MSVIGIGYFDGVHIGHKKLIETVVEIAEETHVSSAILTFDTHPTHVMDTQKVKLIQTNEEREYFIHRAGIENVIFLAFNPALREMHYIEFIQSILKEKMNASHVVVGQNFRFGYRGEGDVDKLRLECQKLGIGLTALQPVRLDGVEVSSTHIRGLLLEGNIKEANRFLGGEYMKMETVHHGEGIGRNLDAPTINLTFSEEILLPKYGVYKTRTILGEKMYKSITNVGICPTICSQYPHLETHILEFEGDLYSEKIRVEFMDFIREERRFESRQELMEQIAKDKALI